MMKKNCWEFKKCGREPGGNQVSELGVCPATEMRQANGLNEGDNGGRSCWAIAGTFCGGKIQGEFANKLNGCMGCDFYEEVMGEQGDAYEGTVAILKKVRR